MKSLKYTAVAAVCTLTLLSISGCTTVSNSYQSTAPGKPEYLFVLHADNGRIVEKQDKAMYLVLHEPIIYAFTDRPYHKSQHINTKQFAALWQKKMNDNFLIDNPNAALAGVDYVEKNKSSAAQELSQLVVLKNMSYDSKSGDVSFKVSALNPGQTLVSSQFNHAVLFVDNMNPMGF